MIQMPSVVRNATIKIAVAAMFAAAPIAAVSIPGYAAANTPAVLPAPPPADPPTNAPAPPAPPQQNYEYYNPDEWYNAGADGGGGGGGGG